MKKFIDYLLSFIYVIFFSILLLIFHPIQFFCYNIIGPKAQKKSIDVISFLILYGLYILGTRIRFIKKQNLQTGRPIIFISNHQSIFDIVCVLWFFRKHTPIFVAKKALGRGIPSISYNLKKSGAALIDRKDSAQSVVEISRLSKHIHKSKSSAVIFPEGTRSVTGKLRPFATGGIYTLLKNCSDALIVPIAIDGTSRVNNSKGIFPLASLQSINIYSLDVIEPNGMSINEIADIAEKQIKEYIKPV